MAEPIPEWLRKLLDEESFLKNHSHYMNVRLNHKSHGIYALYYLGATREFIQKYIESVDRVVPAYHENEELTEPLEIDFIKSDQLEDYISRNQGFYKMLSMFTKIYQEKYNGKNIVQMIKDTCSDKFDGPLYSAFHSLIHTAYGYVVGSEQVMLEAITLTHHQYSPLFFNSDPDHPKRNDMSRFGKGQRSLLNVLEDIHNNRELVDKMYEELQRDAPLRKEIHMFGVFNWAGIRYHSEEFVDLTDSIKLPDFFDKDKKDMEQLIKLVDWWFDMTVLGFVANERPNDFFVLHGLTSAWSTRYVFPLLDFDSALKSFRSMIAGFLMTYCLQHAPTLSKKPEDYFQCEVNEKTWKDLIDNLYDEPIYETHVYKVIQCTYEAWKRNPNSQYVNYYYAAAKLCREQKFSLRDDTYSNLAE